MGSRRRARSAETRQSSVASLSANTIAACDGYVTVPALGALARLLDAMGENQTFVETVRTELLAADNHDGGPITISDAALAAALAVEGRRDPAADRAVRPDLDRRHPADLRVRRRSDLCGERQHDPPGQRPRVPGRRGCAEHRPHVQLRGRRSSRCVRAGVVVGPRHDARSPGRPHPGAPVRRGGPHVHTVHVRLVGRRRRHLADRQPSFGTTRGRRRRLRRPPRPRTSDPFRHRRGADRLGGRRGHRRGRAPGWSHRRA